MIFLLALIAAAVHGQDLDATSFITATSTSGISWSYQVSNPDLDGDVGKYYYVLTDDATTLTEDGVRLAMSPLNGNADCAGSVNQVDEEFHPMTLNCPLEIGVNYKFWIVVDFNGDGTEQVMTPPGGIPLTVIAPTDCIGSWSTCSVSCSQTYTITTWNAGGGAECTDGDQETRACTGGDCPSTAPPVTGIYSGSAPSTTGFTFNYNLLTPAVDANKNWYYCLTPTTATVTNEQIRDGGNNCACSGSVSQSPNNQNLAVTCSPGLTAGSQYTLNAVVGDSTSVSSIGSTSVMMIPGGGNEGGSGDDSYTMIGQNHYCEFNDATEGINDSENEEEGGEIEEAGDIETEEGETEIGVLSGVEPEEPEEVETEEVETEGVETETETEGGETETETEEVETEGEEPGDSESETETEGEEEAEGEENEIEEGEEEELEDGINAVGYGTIIYLKDPTNAQLSTRDPATCASWVNQNRANGGGCSRTFYVGGRTDVCGCVREGQMCDMDESDMGHSVYQLNNPNPMGTAPLLGKEHAQPSAGPVEFFGIKAQYLIPIAVVFGVGLGLWLSKKRQNEMEDYHIQLDDEVHWGV